MVGFVNNKFHFKKSPYYTVLQQSASQQIPSLQVHLLPSLQIRCNGAEAISFLKQGIVFLAESSASTRGNTQIQHLYYLRTYKTLLT